VSLKWVAAMLLLVVYNAHSAELVRDLYVAEMSVADRTEVELARAAGAGLAEVLVKVSGTAEVLQLPALSAALKDARAKVLQYSYHRIDAGDAALSARVEFDPAQVRELLLSAGAPIWTATRPAVLVWLVVEEAGERRFVSPSSHPQLAAELAEGFRRRGVPLRFPLFDIADAAALDATDAWQLSTSAIESASSRYRTSEVLAGRMAVFAAGDSAGDWAYFSVQSRRDLSVPRTEAAQFLQAGVNQVVGDMALRYAIGGGAEVNDALLLRVGGIGSYADYAAVVSWLKGLEPIRQTQVTSLQNETLTLSVTAVADAGQLASIIELNTRMQPVVSSVGGGLNYQWQN
jgi:uncharacterized protein